MDDLIRKAEKREELPPFMVEIRTRPDGQIARKLLERSIGSSLWFMRLDSKVEVGQLPIDLRDFRAKRTLKASVRLRLAIPKPGETAVEALASSPSLPTECVRGWVKDVMQAQVDALGPEDLALWMTLNSGKLEDDICKALKEKGFLAEVQVETGDLPDTTREVKTGTFNVRPRDVDWALPVSVGIRLDHAGKAEVKPPANETAWISEIREVVRDYVERHETLDSVRETEAFADRLRQHLDGACLRFGWKIDRMELTSDLSQFQETLIDTFPSEWRSHSGRVFAFRTKVELSIAANGAKRYVQAELPSLRSWTEKNLKTCFDKILFERDTDDLNPDNFDSVSSKLRDCLSRRAEEKGLKVGIVLVEPTIPEWRYLTKREFEVDQMRFGTTNPDHDAVFSMVIQGKFPTVGPAFQAGSDKKPIPQQIKDTGVEAAKLVMQGIELEDYISHFEALDNRVMHNTERSEPVKAELEREISARLLSHLGFVVSRVQVTKIDPEIREKQAQLLREGPREFVVDVLPDAPGIDDLSPGLRPKEALVPFTLKAELRPPDRQYVVNLALRELDPDRLWGQIEGWVLAALDGRSHEGLRCNDLESHSSLIRLLNDEVGALLLARGVGIDFLSIERGNSEVEQGVIDEKITQPLTNQRHQKALDDLRREHELEYERSHLTGERIHLEDLQAARTKAVENEAQSLSEVERAMAESRRAQRNNRPQGEIGHDPKTEDTAADGTDDARKNRWSKK
ncbi:hypothetical protein [uncultured Roseobacter sp.]|uniref:hypothetical protein n=1 Tax=uncultured Roseobacter sp. TaxID=114847 RepID=UPI002623D164|nr:hypothetical protein [uncultured Roseobacter sp.]